jgi:hypothetical protein
MPIDHRDVLPGDRIEAVRHWRQGDRQGRGIFLVHGAVIVVQALALGIEHLDGTEVGGNPLTEPEDHSGRWLLEHGVRLGDGAQEIRMGTHTLGQPQGGSGHQSQQHHDGEGMPSLTTVSRHRPLVLSLLAATYRAATGCARHQCA